MKTTLLVLFLAFAGGTVYAQVVIRRIQPATVPVPSMTLLDLTRSGLSLARPNFRPRDPWRQVNGVTNYTSGGGWLQFVGKVVQVRKDGFRIVGWFGNPMSCPDARDFTEYQSKQVFANTNANDAGIPVPLAREYAVVNFPYAVADGDLITWEDGVVALPTGTYSYSNGLDSSRTRTVRKLDYGVVTGPPPPRELTQAEKEARAKAAAKKKAELDARVIAHHQSLADQNDLYGIYQMGRRYVAGDGVVKDETKGYQLLQKAIALGSPDAKALLDKLLAEAAKPSNRGISSVATLGAQ